ncbi:MAG: nucleoside hydrolase [Gemmatimonadetes bacterium]|nr:nucleoside hydrolase [Gemmatimonadota bacterium]
MSIPRRVVIDTDPGIDDVVTLALAARSPEIQILAVTTTYGNAPVELTTRNARAILRLAGRPDVPVVPGAARPLSRPLVTAPETHGESGVGHAPVGSGIPPVSPRPTALLEVLRGVRGPITLLTLGPLTNLAVALATDEALVRRRVAHHIGMFGSIHERGNTNRWADFNAWCDPEAADLVIRSRIPTHMVGLDVTRLMTLSAREVRFLADSPSKMVRWLTAALQFYVEFHRSQERLDGCVVNDVLTVGELLARGTLGFQPLGLAVDLDDNEHRGHTRETRAEPPLPVAMTVHVGRMRHLMSRIFGNAWLGEHGQKGSNG